MFAKRHPNLSEMDATSGRNREQQTFWPLYTRYIFCANPLEIKGSPFYTLAVPIDFNRKIMAFDHYPAKSQTQLTTSEVRFMFTQY